jgi:TetR/AcrR family transcriptional regulator, fatty acid metabolism regulator protein
LVDRATAQEDKRRLILDAAVRVFAQKGYHTSRVGDIAEEAGVAYGLLYHYFGSKEEVLETVFRETWGLMLEAVHGVEETGEPAPEQLRKVAAIVLRSWKRTPDVVRVLVREVTRSPQIQREIAEIEQAFAALERIVQRGQEAGDFRDDLEPRLGAWIFYGALDEFLTGWVLGQLPDDEDAVEEAIRTVVTVVCGGLAAERARTTSVA